MMCNLCVVCVVRVVAGMLVRLKSPQPCSPWLRVDDCSPSAAHIYVNIDCGYSRCKAQFSYDVGKGKGKGNIDLYSAYSRMPLKHK